jgi:hypothetical protein
VRRVHEEQVMKTQKPGVCGRQAGALAVCLAWPQVAANHHVHRSFSAAGPEPAE